MSKTLTFDEINWIAADHARAEATMRDPNVAAVLCIAELAERLAVLDTDDRAAALRVLEDEIRLVCGG